MALASRLRSTLPPVNTPLPVASETVSLETTAAGLMVAKVLAERNNGSKVKRHLKVTIVCKYSNFKPSLVAMVTDDVHLVALAPDSVLSADIISDPNGPIEEAGRVKGAESCDLQALRAIL